MINVTIYICYKAIAIINKEKNDKYLNKIF